MKIGKRQLSFILVLIVAVAGMAAFVYYQNIPREIIRYNFYGAELVFRDDLRNAKNVTAYPDEESILNKVWDPEITKINIVYVPTPEPSVENSMLSVNAFEVRFKLDIAYRQLNWINEFDSAELKSFENISYPNDTLVIALVRPSLADSTAVELGDNIVYIKGKTSEDLTRATIKFLMVAMNITV